MGGKKSWNYFANIGNSGNTSYWYKYNTYMGDSASVYGYINGLNTPTDSAAKNIAKYEYGYSSMVYDWYLPTLSQWAILTSGKYDLVNDGSFSGIQTPLYKYINSTYGLATRLACATTNYNINGTRYALRYNPLLIKNGSTYYGNAEADYDYGDNTSLANYLVLPIRSF